MLYKIYYQRKYLGPWRQSEGQYSLKTFDDTHIFVCKVKSENISTLYWYMQMINWDIDDEKFKIIRDMNLSHTSMSFGDVIEDEYGSHYMRSCDGWCKLTDDIQN